MACRQVVNVAFCYITLHLAENRSLKGKRQILRSLTTRVRHRFNVAIAEVDENDLLQVASLGLCCVSNSAGHAAELLDRVNRFIDDDLVGKAEVVGRQTEVVAAEL